MHSPGIGLWTLGWSLSWCRENRSLHTCQDMIYHLGRGYCGGLRQECGLVAGTMAGYLLLEVELCSEPRERASCLMGPNPLRPRQAGPKEGIGSAGIPQGKRDKGRLRHHGPMSMPCSRWAWSGQAKVLQAGHRVRS